MHIGRPYHGSAAHAAMNPFAGEDPGSAFQPDFFGTQHRPMDTDLPAAGPALSGAPGYTGTAAPSAAAPMLSQQQHQQQQQYMFPPALPSSAELPAPQPFGGVPSAAAANAQGFPVRLHLDQHIWCMLLLHL